MSPLFRGPDTRPRKYRTGASPVRVGILTLLLIGIGVYFGFAKDVPFTKGYQLEAVFESANSIRKSSPVRIAGVTVGKVGKVEPLEGSDAALVTLKLDDTGLPIHEDATLKIRPRIFLEGNFYVEMSPGSPSAPALESGDRIPITQTSEPVQLDQVLTALQSDTREDLQQLLKGYGQGLTYEPTAADDVGHDPEAQGLTGAEALNAASQYAVGAFRDSAIVQDAFLGTERHDLSRVVKGLGDVSEALGRDERALQELVTNFNRTMAAFASESANLQTTIGLLPSVLRNANDALDSLNAAFPSTRAFAREILPGVRETPATIAAFFPWLDQATPLISDAELGGLVNDLSPATRDLANLTDATIELLPQADLLSLCFSKVILPTGDVVIQDTPELTTGVENYKEFWYTMAALAGEGQNFDGNGPYVRFQTGGGTGTISTGEYGGAVGDNSTAGDVLFANPGSKPLGTRPAYPALRPPYNRKTPCYTNTPPDLNSAKTGPPDGQGTSTRSVGRPLAPLGAGE